jgi:hypothetical protein
MYSNMDMDPKEKKELSITDLGKHDVGRESWVRYDEGRPML